MNVFVTGGTGFIGSWLVPQLAAAGHSVMVLSRSGCPGSETDSRASVRFVKGHFGNPDTIAAIIKDFGADVLVHLAWEGLPQYSTQYCLKNLHGSIDLFAAALAAGCSTIVSTGSCWEYKSRQTVLAEDDELNCKDLFPAVKNALRFTGNALAIEKGARFFWLPLFFVYGPGQRSGTLIPSIVEAARAGRIPQIRTPLNRNDFIHVEDVARAIAAIIEQPLTSAVYNVGSGVSTSVQEILTYTYQYLGVDFDLEAFNQQATPVQNFYADITKICHDIDWQPAWNVDRGIASYIEWAAKTA